MVDVASTVVIDMPREIVANFAADPSNTPAWYVNIKSVDWHGDPVVAVGSKFTGVVDCAVLTSPDGINWTSANPGTTNFLLTVNWDGSQLIAAGYLGTILTSPDGINWTNRNSGTTNSLRSVTWTGSLLVAVGAGDILTSPEGINWAGMNSGVTNQLSSVTWTGTQFVAVGYPSTIITSPEDIPTAIAPRLRIHNRLSLRLTPSHLFATFPNSLRGQNLHAALYTLSGHKVREVKVSGTSGEIAISTNGMARGMYLFEVGNGEAKAVQPFSIAR